MAPYIRSGLDATLLLLGPMLLVAFIAGILFGLPGISLAKTRREPTPSAQQVLGSYAIGALYAAVFSLFGLVAGVLAGNSRGPAIGNLLPAVLALLGSLVAIFVNFTALHAHRLLAVSCSLSLALSTLLGTIWGAHMRDYGLNSKSSMVRRANLLVLCRAEEERAKELLVLRGLPTVPMPDLKCSEYPR